MPRSLLRTNALATLIAVFLSIIAPLMAVAQDEKAVLVNVENFARAETSAQFDRALAVTGGVNEWLYVR